jgi:hypothetical protein
MANTSHPLSSNLIYSLIGSSSGHLNFTDEKDKALRGYANLSCVLQSRKESDPDPCQQTSCLAAYKVLLGMEFSSLTSPWVFLQSPCPHSLLPCRSHHLLKLTMAIQVHASLSISWLQPQHCFWYLFLSLSSVHFWEHSAELALETPFPIHPFWPFFSQSKSCGIFRDEAYWWVLRAWSAERNKSYIKTTIAKQECSTS